MPGDICLLRSPILFPYYSGERMKETLEMINRMQSDGVISKYAIGGAVGATLYLEPSATLDIDVFAILPDSASWSTMA